VVFQKQRDLGDNELDEVNGHWHPLVCTSNFRDCRRVDAEGLTMCALKEVHGKAPHNTVPVRVTIGFA